MNFKSTLNLVLIIGIACFVSACGKGDSDPMLEELPPIPTEFKGPYLIQEGNILENGQTISYKGINTLQTFGLGEHDLMNEWNVQLIREFIGNLREQPIDGSAIQGSDNVWYHPLQEIVDRNRANNKITILCPFGWVNNSGERTLFTGLNPSAQPFYIQYKTKMRQIAEHFKDQLDVWIEVWNEPFHWNNQNEYSDALWLNDMADMVDNLRWVEDFQNIILVPGNEQGQSEEVILTKGNELQQGRYNLLFDLHAYEKWLLNSTENEIVTRIQNLKNENIPFIIGEIGVQNVGEVMPVQHFLNAAVTTEITVLAWLWNLNSDDKNALLNSNGSPNASILNNFWGSKYKEFLAK